MISPDGARGLLAPSLHVLVAAVAGLAPASAVSAAGDADRAGGRPAPQASAFALNRVDMDAAAEAIRPFRVRVPQGVLDDLRRRLAATRWPGKETIGDASQGAQLANLQGLVGYWGTRYDWRKGRGQAQRLPAVHDAHRRRGRPLPPRPLQHPDACR
jgi:hypothetical protein